MKKLFLYTVLLTLFVSCKGKQSEKPAFLNPAARVSIPSGKFHFESAHKKWKAVLLSFTQPVPLRLEPTGIGFNLSLSNNFGVTEGPAQVVLSSADQFFYYDVYLVNDSAGTITERDYRFPKTVNPDSSLQQQRMQYNIDEWRNIINQAQHTGLFYEDIIQLDPIAGTYRAQKDKPISAFYIQPGSVITIPIASVYNGSSDEYIVTAGPLKDAHSNTVANGTLVTFLYTDSEKDHRTETALINGFASVRLPAKGKTYRIKATIHKTSSNTLQLKP